MLKDQPKTLPVGSPEAIGRRLKATRDALGLKAVEFCRQAGIPQNTYSQYENGKGRPSLDFALKICKTFNVTLDWIYLGNSAAVPHALATAIQNRLS